MTITEHTKALNPEGCIFCRRHDGGFRTREHPFPESLGNTEIVLERGATCDRCNNGRLSDVDQRFLEWPPIALVRTTNAIRTKAGKFPSSKWGNADVTIMSPGELRLNAKSKKAFRTVGPVRPDGYQDFRFNLKTQLANPTKSGGEVAVALWKIALELLYLDHGREVFDHRLDEAREMVLGQTPAQGWLGLVKDTVPVGNVSLTYWWPPRLNGALQPSAFVYLNAYGVQLGTDLLVRVPPKPRGEAAEAVDLIVF